MRNDGGHGFGPRMRKPSKKKDPTKLMKISRKQLKKSREFLRVSMVIKYNNDHVQGDGNVAKRDTKNKVVARKTQRTLLKEPRVVPQTNNLIHSLRPNDGMPSSSKLLPKIIERSMPSSSKAITDVVSFRTTIKSSSPNNVTLYLKNDSEKSRPYSSRPTTKGEASLTKNTDMPRSSSSRLNNDRVSSPVKIKKSWPSLTKNADIPRSSSSKLNNDKVLSKPYSGLVPSGKNNESLKSRPSRPENKLSSVSKDDSNSIIDILKESKHSSILGNSRTALQNVNSRKRKPSLSKDEGTNAEKFKSTRKKPMDYSIQHENRNIGLLEDDRTIDDTLRKRTNTLSPENPETHGDNDNEEVENRRPRKIRRRLILNDYEDDDDGDDNAEKFKSTRKKPMDYSIQLENRNIGLVEDDRTIDDKLRKKTNALSPENPETHEDNDSEEVENRRPRKIRRRLILNDYEDDDDGDDNLAGVELYTAGLITQTPGTKDSSIKVSDQFLLESLKLQQYGSLPIDEPVWSGLIKISSKEFFSLAAHLSTKCCAEVWKLAGSLQPEILVTKISRMEAWPKSFEASRPTDDNIALYFLPCQMRQDAGLDQLVKEIVDNDMVLQAAIGETEMLIFPSVLLPEQHKTFQGKPYLWAVFKGRKNKVATVEAEHGKRVCAEDEMGKQQASHSSVDNEGHSVAQLNTDTGPEAHSSVDNEGHRDRVAQLNTDTGPEAPEEMERQGMEQEQNPPLARANTPSPATGDPTMNATTSANHGQIHSSLAVPTGALFGFVVQQNPRVVQLIQGLQREGAVVVAMRGEMIGSGLGQATASDREGTGRMQQPSSS